MNNLGDDVHRKLKEEEKEIRNEFVEVVLISGEMKSLIVHTLSHDLSLRSVYFIQEEAERKGKQSMRKYQLISKRQHRNTLLW